VYPGTKAGDRLADCDALDYLALPLFRNGLTPEMARICLADPPPDVLLVLHHLEVAATGPFAHNPPWRGLERPSVARERPVGLPHRRGHPT